MCDGIVLVETNCKECAQQLRLFEAIAYGNLCENCIKNNDLVKGEHMSKVMITTKVYKCTCCGNEQEESTNHEGDIFVYCKKCSCKAFYMGTENSIATPQHRHCRRFVFVKEANMKNPYSQEEYNDAKEKGLNLDNWNDYVKYFGIGENETYE